MKRTLIAMLLIIVTVTCVVALVACNKSEIFPEESTYDYEYISTYEGENDLDISIDGKLDEDAWQGKKWFRNTFTNNLDGTMPYLNVTAFTTEYGVYIGAKVEDNNLIYHGEFSRYDTSIIEMIYYVYDVDDERELNPDYDQDFISRRLFFMNLGGKGYGTGEKMKRNVYVDGELNSGATKYATWEIFIAWSELGIEPKIDAEGNKIVPENVYILPVYHAILRGKTTEQSLKCPFTPFVHMNSFWVFDKDGFTDADSEGAVLGDSHTGLTKSGCWDMDNIADGEVSISTGIEQSWIFAKDICSSNFVAETTIIPYGKLTTDSRYQGAYCGFYLLDSTDICYCPTIDFTQMQDGVNGTKTITNVDLRTISTKGGWVQRVVGSTINENAGTVEGIKLRLIKQGANLHYFVNDNYLATETVDYLPGDVFVGLFSNNAAVKFTDYSFSTLTEQEVANLLGESDVFTIYTETVNRGGNIACGQQAVKKGGSTQVEITLESGYTVKSLLVNGQEKVDSFFANATAGVYDIDNIQKNTEVFITFEKIADCKTLSGNAMRYGVETSCEMTLVGKDNSIKALKYMVDVDSSGYSVDVVAGHYYAELVNGDITSAVSNRSEVYDIARAVSLDVTSDLVYDFTLHTGRNLVYDATTETVTTVSNGFVHSGSHISLGDEVGFIRKSNGSFVVGMDITATQSKDPNVGFSIKDGNGHSVQFYINDTVGVRLLFGYAWNSIAAPMGVTASSFTINGNQKICNFALAYDAESGTFNFIINNITSAKLTRDEINAYIKSKTGNQNYKFTDYLADGDYSIEICVWQAQAVDGRDDNIPLIEISDIFAITEKAKVDEYIKQHPLYVSKNAKYNDDGSVTISGNGYSYFDGSASVVYLKTTFDISNAHQGITIFTDSLNGNNAQIGFQANGYSLLKDYVWRATNTGDVFSNNKMLGLRTETVGKHTVEYFIVEGKLYIIYDGQNLFDKPLALSDLNGAFTADAQYHIGIYNYDGGKTLTASNMEVLYGAEALAKFNDAQPS